MAAPSPGSALGVPQAIPIDQFLKCLLDSGLFQSDEVKALREAQPGDTRTLAQELINQGKLTRYQATMLCQGKTKGLILGNYVVLDKLGQGGMGMVFRAQHRRMKREVALKVLSPKITSNPTAVQRFQREVEAAAKLSHPNIVAAHDADEDRGVHFLVMELVEGADLASLVKKQGPFPVAHAVDAIIQTAHGLMHAHNEGIVHRDIKPHNLLRAGKPGATGNHPIKILDMGLARMDAGNSAPAGELTESGSIMGTCDYMAPEQALNTKRADHRADIYSLGCTLYYLLTGRVMYAGETAMEKLMAHQQDPIPVLSKLRPDVPDELEQVYERMVAKKIDDRFQSMAEVIAALEACQGQCPAVTSKTIPLPAPLQSDVDAETRTEVPLPRSKTKLTRTKPKPKRPRWLIPMVIVGVLLLAVVGIALRNRNRNRAEEPTPAAPGGSDDAWVNSVQAMPAEQQADAVAAKLRELNPGYPGFVGKQINNGHITEWSMNCDRVADISPLRALTHLTHLSCTGSTPGKGKLADLRPLSDLPLTHLKIHDTQVSDLLPLSKMQLVQLHADRTLIADLKPLRGMPLVTLKIAHTFVSDLRPIRGMPLQLLNCDATEVTDLTPLRDSPLKELTCPSLPLRDMMKLHPIKTLDKVNGKEVPDFLKKIGPKGF